MLDLRGKAAQLIIPRVDGNLLLEEDYFNRVASLVDEGIGGFILFNGKLPQTVEAINKLQKRAKTPLLITSDIERGLGQQLAGGTRFPNQWAVAEAIDKNNPGDVALLHEMLTAVREECIAAGIHAVFSPVADVNVNPENPIICTRSFGEEPEEVAWFVAEYVKGLQNTDDRHDSPSPGLRPPSPTGRGVRGEGSLLSCGKHFPGHGDTATDSHTSLPVINAGLKRLRSVELPPFQAAIDAGVAMIMVGHLQVPALEPEPIPATFSRRIVTDLLRHEMGFKGLIVTDALDMGALKAICDEGESAVRSLEAGCDILLHPSEPLKVLDTIVNAIKSGRLSEERIEESFARVMSLKSEVKCQKEFNTSRLTLHASLAYKLARKAVKFRKGSGLKPVDAIACLVIDDDGDGSVAGPFVETISQKVSHLKMVSAPSEISREDSLIIPVFSRISAWKGSSGLSEASAEKIREAVKNAGRAAIISFGSPYILNNFEADAMMDAFDPAEFVQRAAVEMLVESEGWKPQGTRR